MKSWRSKHVQVPVISPTKLLGAQIVDIFVKELHIDGNNLEIEDESTEALKVCDEVSKDKTESEIKDTENQNVESNVEHEEKKISSSYKKLQHVLQELLETEVNYVQDLEEVLSNSSQTNYFKTVIPRSAQLIYP